MKTQTPPKVFNWAQERTEHTYEIYKKIWLTLLCDDPNNSALREQTEKEFEEFYNKCNDSSCIDFIEGKDGKKPHYRYTSKDGNESFKLNGTTDPLMK